MFGAYPIRKSPAQLQEMSERAEEALYEAASPAVREPAPPPLVMSHRPIRVLDRFSFDKTALSTDHLRSIDHVARHVVATWRKGGPVRNIRLVGHTDGVGPPAYNAQLGRRRASAVLRRLRVRLEQLRPGITKGIIFLVESAGATRPAANNRTAVGRSENRRVEIFLTVERKKPRPPAVRRA